MKFLKDDAGIPGADSGDDAATATGLLEARLAELEQQVTELPAGHSDIDKAELQLQAASMLLDLKRMEEAASIAREIFDVFAAAGMWEQAVMACDILYRTDQPESLAALGQGIWLAVTFPVSPELTVAMLQHVVDETPDDSDGGAVAAAVAHYITELRATGREKDELQFFTGKLLAAVSRRHSDVENQEQFDAWMEKLELNDPEKFLPRMRNVVDVLVQEDWWIDREAIWASLPVN